jgi:DNA-binding GntR family transcriptional regulator
MNEIAPRLDVGIAIPDHVAHLLGREIIFGRLAPLTRLTEEEVAAMYRVSRSPVREAIRLLEHDGLVQRSARKGIWVAPLSAADFDEVYVCRAVLEGLAAESAAGSPAAAAARPRFEALLQRLRAAETTGDAQGLFEVDVEGSELIYSLAANATLRRLLTCLEKQALRYRLFAYEKSTEVVKLSIDSTATIYECIAGGDTHGARSRTEALIREISHMMRPLIAASCQEAN